MFAEKAKKVHSDKYDYSLVEYKSAKTKVKIICNKHGVFEQTPSNHLSGKGCRFCAKNVKYTNEEIVEMFKREHKNKYSYGEVKYESMFKKVKIKCITHNFFEQTPKNHLMGKGCPKCAGKKLDKYEIINELTNVHEGVYDYSQAEPKKSKDKIKIICKTHGVFLQTLDCHKRGQGCPNCKKSKGVNLVKKFLEKNNLQYENEFTFDQCRNPKTQKLLPFDFYIPIKNTCIEYDGEQHFKPMRFSRDNQKSLEDIKFRDNIKDIFCKNNNINLLRINFKEFNDIEKLLTFYFFNQSL
jgi:hypothetical protein